MLLGIQKFNLTILREDEFDSPNKAARYGRKQPEPLRLALEKDFSGIISYSLDARAVELKPQCHLRILHHQDKQSSFSLTRQHE